MAMPRPVTLALTLVCVGLIGLLVILFFKRDKPPIPVRSEEREPASRPVSPEASDRSPPVSPPAFVVKRPSSRAPAQPDARQLASDASLLEQLHALAGSDPELSLRLAREAVKRFPDSPNAPEFEWNVAKALFNLNRIDEAEAEARSMLSKYPGNYFTGDVVHHLLNHPPNPSDLSQ